MTHYSGGPPGSPPPGSPPPGPPPGPAFGPPGPGRHGWAPPPQAPKPGVIPLRPLGLGDIMGGTFAAFGRCWKALIGVAALAYGAALLVTGGAAALALWSLDGTFTDLDNATRADVGPVVLSLLLRFALVALVGAVCTMWATAMTQAATAAALQQAVLGHPARFGAVWGRALRRFPAVFGALLLPWLGAFLVTALLLSGYVTLMLTLVDHRSGEYVPDYLVPVGFAGGLLLIPLVVWLWVLFSLAPAVAVFESAGPVAALRRSARLIKGSWWRVLGISLLLWIMALVAGWFIQIPFGVLGMFSMIPGMDTLDGAADTEAVEILAAMGGYLLFTLLGGFVSQIVVTVFPQLTTGLLYVDQRIRQEDLAPVLVEAAYGPPPRQPHR